MKPKRLEGGMKMFRSVENRIMQGEVLRGYRQAYRVMVSLGERRAALGRIADWNAAGAAQQVEQREGVVKYSVKDLVVDKERLRDIINSPRGSTYLLHDRQLNPKVCRGKKEMEGYEVVAGKWTIGDYVPVGEGFVRCFTCGEVLNLTEKGFASLRFTGPISKRPREDAERELLPTFGMYEQFILRINPMTNREEVRVAVCPSHNKNLDKLGELVQAFACLNDLLVAVARNQYVLDGSEPHFLDHF